MMKRKEIPNPINPGITDLFNSTFKLPQTVYILASGMNGVSSYKRIPKDACIIAVNRACELYFTISNMPKPYVWVVVDSRVTLKSYFKEVNDRFDGIRCFSKIAANCTERYGVRYPDKSFDFNVIKKIGLPNEFIPVARTYQIVGTVAGMGLWLCYLKNVKVVHLVGVDLSGDIDFTGKVTEDGVIHGEIWNCAKRLDLQIEWQKKQGMRILTMSPTKLKSVEIGY